MPAGKFADAIFKAFVVEAKRSVMKGLTYKQDVQILERLKFKYMAQFPKQEWGRIEVRRRVAESILMLAVTHRRPWADFMASWQRLNRLGYTHPHILVNICLDAVEMVGNSHVGKRYIRSSVARAERMLVASGADARYIAIEREHLSQLRTRLSR